MAEQKLARSGAKETGGDDRFGGGVLSRRMALWKSAVIGVLAFLAGAACWNFWETPKPASNCAGGEGNGTDRGSKECDASIKPQTSDFLSADPGPEELLRPLSRPPAIDGRMEQGFAGERLYRCPDMADVPAFLESLWAIYRLKLDEQDKIAPDKRVEMDLMAPTESMDPLLAKAGCKRQFAVAPVKYVIAWHGLINKRHVNDDRWIAFKTQAKESGFYLTWSGSVD
jgi:hypothetical protein